MREIIHSMIPSTQWESREQVYMFNIDGDEITMTKISNLKWLPCRLHQMNSIHTHKYFITSDNNDSISVITLCVHAYMHELGYINILL